LVILGVPLWVRLFIAIFLFVPQKRISISILNAYFAYK